MNDLPEKKLLRISEAAEPEDAGETLERPQGPGGCSQDKTPRDQPGYE
jgi:hypothetical protein